MAIQFLDEDAQGSNNVGAVSNPFPNVQFLPDPPTAKIQPSQPDTTLSELPKELGVAGPTDEQAATATAETAARKQLGVQESVKRANDISQKWQQIISMAQESGRQDSIPGFEAQRDAELRAVGSEPVSAPVVSTPKTSTQDITTLTGMTGRPAAVAAKVVSGVSSVAEGFLQPEGAVMFTPGGAAAFVAQMATSVPASIGEAVGAYSGGDTEAGDTAIINAAVTAGLLVIPHALAKEKKPPTLDDIVGKEQADAIRTAIQNSKQTTKEQNAPQEINKPVGAESEFPRTQTREIVSANVPEVRPETRPAPNGSDSTIAGTEVPQAAVQDNVVKPPPTADLPNRNPPIQLKGPDGNLHWFTFDGYQDFTGYPVDGKDRGVQPQLTSVYEAPGKGILKGGTTYGYRLTDEGYTLPDKLPTDDEIQAYKNAATPSAPTATAAEAKPTENVPAPAAPPAPAQEQSVVLPKPTTIIKGIDLVPKADGSHALVVDGEHKADVRYVDSKQLQLALNSDGRMDTDASTINGYFLPGAEGKPGTILLNTDHEGLNPVFTHETTHLLKASGLINDEQINSIVDKYGSTVVDGTTINDEVRARYSKLGLTEPQIREEVFANIFQHWHESNKIPKVSYIQRAVDFFRKLFTRTATARQHAQDILAGRFQQPGRASALAPRRGSLFGTGGRASVPQNKIFYRGTNPESEQRIKEVFTEANGKTFAAKKPESAALYGSSIEEIKAKPDAKILYENTKEFGKISGIRGYDPEIGLLNQRSVKSTLIDVVNKAIKGAKKSGYDAISFKDDSGIGTVILNESAFERPNQPTRIQPQFSVSKDQTETPEFKKWFGASRVVDSDGKPLVVYHGTDAGDFSTFAVPAYFTENSSEASAYSNAMTLKRTERLQKKYIGKQANGSLDGKQVPYIGVMSDIPEDQIGVVWATDNGVAERTKSGFKIYTDVIDKPGSYNHQNSTVDLTTGDSSQHLKDAVDGINEFIARLQKDSGGTGEGGRVYPVYLTIKNPKILSPLEGNRFAKRLGAGEDESKFIQQLKSEGYDGIETISDEASMFPDVAEEVGSKVRQFIPFDPTQIKSAIGNNGKFDASNPDIRFSVAKDEPRPIWRDNILDALTSWQPKGTPEQLLAHLAKFRGTKDQADWIGLSDFLKDKKSVTKSEVEDFVRANQLQVSEVVKGGEQDKFKAVLKAKQLEEDARLVFRTALNSSGWGKEAAILKAARILYEEEHGSADTRDLLIKQYPGLYNPTLDYSNAIKRRINTEADNGASIREDKTKYRQYQIPGGDQYRELLLTLPEKNVDSRFPFPSYETWLENEITPEFRTPEHDAVNRRVYESDKAKYTKLVANSSGAFKSSHFDEPNIVGHIRFNERQSTTADNPTPVRTMHLEEIQSDAHQQGRKHGYINENTKRATTAVRGNEFWRVNDANGDFVSNVLDMDLPAGATAKDAVDEANRRVAQEPTRVAVGKQVPDFPFKTSWPMLLFKRALRWAVDNNFKRITWTSGEQQAERYDLSKQIDSLKVHKIEFPEESAGYHVEALKDGGKVIEHVAKTEADLEALIGKELAKKAVTDIGNQTQADASRPTTNLQVQRDGMREFKVVGKDGVYVMGGFESRNKAQEWADAQNDPYEVNYSGLDLKVGGEGMKGFYDKILPSEVGKFVKRYGGRVGESDIAQNHDASGNERFESKQKALSIFDQGGEVYGVDAFGHESLIQSRNEITADDYKQFVMGDKQPEIKVHSLDITPELKSAALGGLPMFSVAKDNLSTADKAVEQQRIAKELGQEEVSKRAQVGGIKEIGQMRPVENIEDAQIMVRKYGFDARQPVAAETTSKAWDIFESLTDPTRRGTVAQEMKNRMGGTDMTLGLLQGELRNYALKLAASGDRSLFIALLNHSADFQTLTGGGDTTAGRALRAAQEFATTPVMGALKEALTNERDRAAARGLKITEDNFTRLNRLLDELSVNPEEIDSLIQTGKTSDGKTIADILDESTPASREAQSILDQYEQSQTEWLKPPNKLTEIRKIIKESLGGKTAKYTVEKEFTDFVSQRFQEADVPKELADRLAFEVWKDKAARESARTAKASDTEARRETRNAESLLDQWAKEQTDWVKPTVKNETRTAINEWLRRKTVEADKDGWITSLGDRLKEIGVADRPADEISRAAWDRKQTLDANERLRATKDVTSEAQRIAAAKLNQLELKHSGVDWLKEPTKRDAVQKIISDALMSDAPVDVNPLPVIKDVQEKLMAVGVDEATAGRLAAEIENERTTGFANKRLAMMARAAKSTSLRSLTESILAAPYRMRYDPKWREEIAVRWFESNGLSKEMAVAATKLYYKEFFAAYMKAASKIVETELAKLPPKTTADVVSAIHIGILNPHSSWSDRFAELSGWKKPTTEQFKQLMALDEKLSDPALSPGEIADIHGQMMRVVWQFGKREGQFMRGMAERFVGSMLSGIRTLTVQGAPMIEAIRNLAIASISDPANARAFARVFVDGFKRNLVAEAKFAWQKDAYKFHLGELDLSHSQLERIWQECDQIWKDPKSTPVQKAWARARQLYSINRFVFKVLNTIDNTMMASLQPWKLAYYSSIAFKEAGLSTGEVERLVTAMGTGWNESYTRARAAGLDDLTAKTRANSEQKQVVYDFVSNATASDTIANQILDASEKDLYSTVGRLSPGVSEKDEGWLSNYGPNQLMEAVGKAHTDGGVQSIMAVAAFGFVKIPYRTIRYASNFSAYGLIRYGIDAWRKNHGYETLWKQSFANEHQAKARLREAVAGTLVTILAGAWAAYHQTSDDGAGDEDASLYITGSGPSSKTLRDAWKKRGFRPYALNFVIGGHIVSIQITRVGEMVMFPFIPAAIRDDAAWKNKEQAASGKAQNQFSLYASKTISTALSMMGQAGIFQTVGQLTSSVQQGDTYVKAAAKLGASVVSASVLPLKQLLASFSDMAIGKLDQSSATALIAANFPIVGIPWQHPALNRLGDKIGDRSWYGLIADTGVPVEFQIEQSPKNERLYPMLVSKGVSPPELRRSVVEEKYGTLTDDQFGKFAAASGAALKQQIISNLPLMENMTPADAKKFMAAAATGADNQAATGLGLTRQVVGGKLQSNEFSPASTGSSNRTPVGRVRGSAFRSKTRSLYKPKYAKIGRVPRGRTSALRGRRGSIYSTKRRLHAFA